MSLRWFRVRKVAVVAAVALAAVACAPATSTTAQPTSASAQPTAATAQPTAAPAQPTSAPAQPTSAPKPAPPPPNPAAATEGQALIVQKGCGACHTIPDVSGANGTIGPNLTGVASRPTIAGGAVQNNGPDDLKRWILDPPAAKPGTQMPKLGLTDDEA